MSLRFNKVTNTATVAQMMADTQNVDEQQLVYQQMQEGFDQSQLPQVNGKPGRLVVIKNYAGDLNIPKDRLIISKNHLTPSKDFNHDLSAPEDKLTLEKDINHDLNMSFDRSQAPQTRTPIGSYRPRGLFVPFDRRQNRY